MVGTNLVVLNEQKRELRVFHNQTYQHQERRVQHENATNEERNGFQKSDQDEFQAILNMGATKVLRGKAAEEARRHCGHWIITSRMIRGKELLPRTGTFKYKSKWCPWARTPRQRRATNISPGHHDVLANCFVP